MRVARFQFASLLDGSSGISGAGGRMEFMPPSLVGEPQTDVIPPPPSYSEEDLHQAEQDGYRRGFLEGEKEGKLQAEGEQMRVDKSLNEMMGTISARLEEMIRAFNHEVAVKKQLLPRIVLTIARKVAGNALQQDALHAIESTVHDTLQRLMGEPHIIIMVHSSLSTALEKRLSAYFANNHEPGEIHIEGSEEIALGDCRISWRSGEVTRDTAELWQQIEALVESRLAPPTPPSDTSHS